MNTPCGTTEQLADLRRGSDNGTPSLEKGTGFDTCKPSVQPPADGHGRPSAGSEPSRAPIAIIALLLLCLIGAGYAAYRAEERAREQEAFARRARQEWNAAEQARLSAEKSVQQFLKERDTAEQARLSAEKTARQLRAEVQRLEGDAEARRVQEAKSKRILDSKESARPPAAKAPQSSSRFGTILLPDGQSYEGDIVGDKRNGQGSCTWLNGEKYTGEWVDDMRNGQGTHIWPNGQTYTGAWVNDKRNGQGSCTWPNGENYTGDWIGDQRNGHGIHTWPNGEKYDGAWVNDKRSGQGSYKWPNGLVQSGTCTEDKLAPQQP